MSKCPCVAGTARFQASSLFKRMLKRSDVSGIHAVGGSTGFADRPMFFDIIHGLASPTAGPVAMPADEYS